MQEQKPDYVLAFDFGASSGRAILGSLKDGKIEMEEVHRFSNDPVNVNGTMYWDTLRQFFEIKQGIVKAKKYGNIKSMGIDTWGVDFGLIDEHGALLENAVHYRDERTAGMDEKVFAKIPKPELYRITGNEFNYFNTIFQLNALKEQRPWMLERADKFLFTPDLFNYFLTGEKRAEYTMATTSSLLDIRKREWSKEVMENIGLREDFFPELIASGSIVGPLKEEICEELGVSPMQVIAVASHDTQSASAAVPTKEKDFIFISCGTWSLYGTELDEPVIGEKSLEMNVSNEGGYGGKINFLKNLTGLWMVQESRRQWIREGKEYGFGELESEAKKVELFQNFVDPNAKEFVPAGNMPERIRTYCKETGQIVPETPGEIVCCINQSLAMKYKRELDKIEYCLGKKYDTIHMIGGGIQSKLLCQMTANATGCRVVAGPVEATALGNIAVQMIALGMIKDISEAREIISRSEKTCVYEPQHMEEWSEAYKTYCDTMKK
ncbi:MAG: rhamnulokinase family protein [Lachnospiraceae bacterium]|nr:rhamnulokinase family protein [Lachnospiraceae bacterium]